MKTQIVWQQKAAFTATTGSGHCLRIDGPPEHGGENTGARPMEVFLSGAAACSAFDVVHILKKGRQPLVDLQVEAEGTRSETPPKIYTKIHLNFKVSGNGLSEHAVARAIQLSVEKYCSAITMLVTTCPVTYSHQIFNLVNDEKTIG